MSDTLPTFSEAKDTVDTVKQKARTLIPWLPDPPACPECGAMMYAGQTFDSREAMPVASWQCRECDGPDLYRDPEFEERIHGDRV